MQPYLTLHCPKLARRYYDTGLWAEDTFYSLLCDRVETTPNNLAFRGTTNQLTWLALKARVDALADDFSDLGLQRGDRVCVWLSNRVEILVTFLACNREGLACNPSIHKTSTCAEVEALLQRLNARVLVTEPGWGADRDQCDLESLLAGVPSLKKVYEPADFPAHILSQDREVLNDPDAVAYLAFTSGTTGEPKCVMHSCNTLLANARDLVRDWALGPDEVILCLSPFSHHIAWVAVAQWLLVGCCLVSNDIKKGEMVTDLVVESNATYVMGVPTHAIDLLEEMRLRNWRHLGRVRTFYLAGAPIPSIVANALARMNIRPQNVYGMTENSSHQYTHPDDSHSIAINTCGCGGDAYKVQVFASANADQPVAHGTVGQIGGHGAALMLGYFDNQLATEQSFNAQGYFLSGDLGYLDEAGNLTVVGRIKDVIIRGGHNIYPAHIESAAMTHPGVAQAAAFAVPDERLGERVCLAVQGSADAASLLRHLSDEGLSKYAMPEWFLSMDSFPLTASGKVLKRDLATRVNQGELVPEAVRFHSESVVKRAHNVMQANA